MLLGRSPSGTQSLPGPVECVWDGETRSLSWHAEIAGYVSADHKPQTILNIQLCYAPFPIVILKQKICIFPRTSKAPLWRIILFKSNCRRAFVTDLFISQTLLVHHFFQLLLPENRIWQYVCMQVPLHQYLTEARRVQFRDIGGENSHQRHSLMCWTVWIWILFSITPLLGY